MYDNLKSLFGFILKLSFYGPKEEKKIEENKEETLNSSLFDSNCHKNTLLYKCVFLLKMSYNRIE